MRFSFAFGARSISASVAGPVADNPQADFLQQDAAAPGVTTDVVVADDVDVVWAGLVLGFGLVEHPVTDRVVGDVMAQRLRHAAEALATDRNDRLAGFLVLLARNGLNVVADQAD